MNRLFFGCALLLLSSMGFAGAGFYQDAGASQFQKVVFDFSAGFEWKRLDTEVDGQYYGHKAVDDTWLLNGGEAFVWKDNGSDILSVTLYYRIYKNGATPPAFSNINVPWAANVGGNNQRWATTAENIDIIGATNSAGLWYVEFYYSATTNSFNCDPVIFFSNGGANYKLSFDRDVISVDLTSFDATAQGNGILLQWSVAAEKNHAGYFVFRSTGKKSDFVRINETLIVSADPFNGINTDFEFFDVPPTAGEYDYKLQAVSVDGSTQMYGPVTAITLTNVFVASTTVGDMWNVENYPNPFNPVTTIRISAQYKSRVVVSVTDVTGREVANVFNGVLEAGVHHFQWNGRTDAGHEAPSGAYMVRVLSDDLLISLC